MSPNWQPPPKPAEVTEQRIIAAILSGVFQIDSNLPGERDLASQLGVTRPTLREALQRLARDGWLEIRQGRPTRVRDYWQEGNLGVLSTIARHQQELPENFVPNLLAVRCLLAPEYTYQACLQHAPEVAVFLSSYRELPDQAEIFAQADFNLHRQLTIFSGNPVFTLILNGFRELYFEMGTRYFNSSQARQNSRDFYHDLYQAALRGEAEDALQITRRVMDQSLELWRQAQESAG